MSAIPLYAFQSDLKPVILELSNADTTLDLFGDRLSSQGYHVIRATTYEEALQIAMEEQPVLIVVYDDPATEVDAVNWIGMQHTQPQMPRLAMTPLLILAGVERVPYLHIEEIPDRIVVLQRRADTLNQLARTVKRLMRVWQVE